MAARRGLVALVVLLGFAAAAVGVPLAWGDHQAVTVESHTEEPQTREDHIRQWQAALSKSGKALPADVDRMTDHEVFEAMWAEWRKHTVLEKQPVVPGG
ncbi:hypothetical protein PV390_21830 [Streptomyces sp. ME02-6991-2A]|uniref:hypothetical protein n=1 Tax=Streptomyces sp. ME02-6991-2A TaxID=3028677 RepID=UPI0010084D34|nr:hypothetical protein [Streptomyces sp. ME02-6991-2A]MDX3377037.1 hypothetical protein [Streptomyces sp. ME02-6991-2A]